MIRRQTAPAGFDQDHWVHRSIVGGRHQDRVNARQCHLKVRSATGGQALPGVMVENLAAAFVALALVGYLLYALIRPDRF
ncbi:hypothetical protein GCM10027579_25420 [Calidifontibacter terrae]